MADLDAIRLQDQQARETERLVISGLAGYLKEAVRMLPMESRMCRAFLISADKFERMAEWMAERPRSEDSSAALEILMLEKKLRRMGVGEDED